MKKQHFITAVIVTLFFLLISCDSKKEDATDPDQNDTTASVTVQGKVVAAETGEDLADAIIKISDGAIVKGTTTDSEGKFSAVFEMDSDRDLTIVAFKAGYFQDTTQVFAIVYSTVEVPLFELLRDESSNVGGFSGKAASIYLYSQSAASIGVKESGALESAQIVFEVMDSSGVVIDEGNSIEVSFRFGSTPNGGEYLYPSSVQTNALGKAAVSINTGTVAGVSEVIAEAVVDGKPIISKPILIAIHGGFPTEKIFYVASDKLNYPALGIIGEAIDFTAYAGDKYNNPVRPGTAVYFTANFGIIGGSNLTDDKGTTTVTLLTEPWPIDEVKGPGFFTVTAQTVDESSSSISTSTTRLLSGGPIISVDPFTFNIENGGSESFTYTLADVNGNPMSEGQNVSISIDSKYYDVAGATEVKFPDTQSPSWTTFSFVAFDTEPDSISVETIAIEISTSGPNGNLIYALTGVGR